MKTAWGLLLIGVFVGFVLIGLSNVATHVITTNENMDNDSIKLYSTTNPIAKEYIQEMQTNYNSSDINPEDEPDLNGISEYLQEFKSYQNKWDKIKVGIKILYSAPDTLFYAIPFVDYQDLDVFIYVYRALFWFLIIIVFIKVLRSGVVD